MNVVLAAIDNSAAARPVLSTAQAVARLTDADALAIHVREDGMATARAAAEAARIELGVAEPPVGEALAAAAARPEVIAMVVGARATPGGRTPAGHTAVEIITAAEKPLVVVPPVPRAPELIQRILVALDGTSASATALRRTMELAHRGELDVVVLHVHEEATLPAFEEQGHHEHEAWTHEFIERWCPGAAELTRLDVRVGPPGPRLLQAIRDVRADLVALAWSQSLAPGRAAVVREALSSSPVPVLLIPVRPTRSK